MKTRPSRFYAILLSVVLGVLPAGLLNAQSRGTFVWKVRILGSDFYLAGSVHAGKPEYYPLPDAFQEAYDHSDRVVLELKENFDTLQNMIFDYGEKDRLGEEEWLNNQLDPEELGKLEDLFKGEEDVLQRLYRYKGWMLNMAIAGRKYRLVGYDPKLGIDRHFNKRATEDGKEITGMESIETQLRLFESDASPEIQLQMVKAALARVEDNALSEKPMIDAYYTYNPAQFESALLGLYDFSNPRVKKAYEIIFTDRNRAWVEKMKELAAVEPSTYFMLVGCGHYFGPGNIRELLEAEGFSVEQLDR
jgi:uncharacterized protein YbaP (TraB family)